jgi:uncharacterized lipoprotein NlpE involved in copper resistance
MMKRTVFFLLLCTTILASCQNEKEQELVSADSTKADGVAVKVDGATAENSLDVVGTYTGILPCADCEGIETVIELRSDSTYTRTVTYLGKKEKNRFSGTGKWSWINGFTITLGSSAEGPAMYDVAENKLIQLDMAGNRIMGELASKYELKKQ